MINEIKRDTPPVESLYMLFNNPEWDHLKDKAFVSMRWPITIKDSSGRKDIIIYEGSYSYISKENYERYLPKVFITNTLPYKLYLY